MIPNVYRDAPDPSGERPSRAADSGAGEGLVGKELLGCRIDRLLGRGGMGEVFLATRLRDGVRLVLKRLAPELASDPRLRARFVREGEALGKLPRHPGLVAVLGVGEEPPVGSGPGRPLLAMEFVEGETLFARLRRVGPAPSLEVARAGIDVARALSVVHAASLVHRDVNPNNLMRTPEGQTKLLDFGLAKDLYRTTLTTPGQLLGTAFYLAPEQLSGGPVDARCDVFALGATLYHLRVGRPPFVGAELADVLEAIADGDYALPCDLAPDTPPALQDVLLQALEHEPRHRYGSTAALAADLERAIAGQPVSQPSFEDAQGQRVSLLQLRRATLGADPSCAVRLTRAAPRHAQVRRDAHGYLLCDLQSPSGTHVDGVPVTTPVRLRHGATLALGPHVLRFCDPRLTD